MALDRILIVDDDSFIIKSLEIALRAKRYSVFSAGTLAEADRLLKKDIIDLVILDVRLPDGDGTDLLERLSTQPERPIVVMMSGHGTIESAVACMKHGAFDYLIKPFSIAQLHVLVKKVESYHQVIRLNQYLNHESSNTDIIGNSPAFVTLQKMIRKVAPTEATVLICGENGTGKELAANSIYNLSSRSQGPYVKINCAAIAENLIESEFFGHEKGSYTGATDRREGRFELANGGTLLLDEISEISPRLQAKLLRVLQEREFERVGGTKTIKVDVRVIATTNRDLKKSVANGDFREDLYYRLNVFPIQMPPLRDRREDVPVLAQSFLDRFSRQYGSKTPGFSPLAIKALLAHQWPGNVRELQNTIERAVIIAEENAPIQVDALGLPPPSPMTLRQMELVATLSQQPLEEIPLPPPPTPEPMVESMAQPTPVSVPESAQEPERSDFIEPVDTEPKPFKSMEELEKEHILASLHYTKGNRTQAASLLKISIRTLRNKLNDYKLDGVEF